MERYEVGMLARSKTGHDKNQVYVVANVDETCVYLINGTNRTIDNPKKKKMKHVQIIHEQHDLSGLDDVAVKRILKLYEQKTWRK